MPANTPEAEALSGMVLGARDRAERQHEALDALRRRIPDVVVAPREDVDTVARLGATLAARTR